MHYLILFAAILVAVAFVGAQASTTVALVAAPAIVVFTVAVFRGWPWRRPILTWLAEIASMFALLWAIRYDASQLGWAAMSANIGLAVLALAMFVAGSITCLVTVLVHLGLIKPVRKVYGYE
jgi:hypothetical protein